MTPPARAASATGRRPAPSDLALTALRRRPAQARGLRRVLDVLDACERLLERRRFEELTIEEIASAAGIPVGSLYHFFADKTAIVLTLLERVIAEEGAAFEFTTADAALSLEQYLAALEGRMLTVWRRHGRVLDLFFAFQRHPLVWQRVLEQRSATAAQVGLKLRQLDASLSVRRANERGRMVSMVMGTLIDNLLYLPAREQEAIRRETYAMLARYVRV